MSYKLVQAISPLETKYAPVYKSNTTFHSLSRASCLVLTELLIWSLLVNRGLLYMTRWSSTCLEPSSPLSKTKKISIIYSSIFPKPITKYQKRKMYLYSRNHDFRNLTSLRKQPTFGDATTGFPAKWRLFSVRNERRNSILLLIGWIKFPTRHDQSEALARSG